MPLAASVLMVVLSPSWPKSSPWCTPSAELGASSTPGAVTQTTGAEAESETPRLGGAMTCGTGCAREDTGECEEGETAVTGIGIGIGIGSGTGVGGGDVDVDVDMGVGVVC